MTTRRLLSIATLYPNAHTPQFGTFVARSLEALAARDDWQVTAINPIGIPPLAVGRYRALAKAAFDGTENGVEVYRPSYLLIPRVGARINPSMIARAVLPLARRLHEERPFDLVDAQFFYPDGPAAAWIARQLGLPYAIKARGADISYWGSRTFAREQMLEAAAGARGLLAVSHALKDDMVALGMPEGRIGVHYTGLDRNRFRPLAHSGLRTKLGASLGIALGEKEKIVASVGALIDRKAQDLVIGAIAGIPGARLLLVGKGEDERYLRGLARDLRVEDRVHFLGSIDHDMLPVVMSAADVMALPSKKEGLANAWVEALACGTPVVISDAGGARELVTGPDAGYIVARDIESIAAALRKLFADPPPRERVAATVDRFGWPAHAAELARRYEGLI
ncbi:glycosyltransferase [Pelagerythrobacter rhizovicinus]|uniref:Glycosyltransferase family 4 protein n=1 Tax=Pelagerythrobacter rhizovicinus TaxID=2268576 RepID=A0A4Q2KPM7_9SPHN|nr:glycosyltransferase [Pelagerythrobacter rhizovicinus]RXZ66559.1 glycosyltransferase family 4 protein [Pelagerythrobacter rhizovicinus]